jgi:hypothetical protein
MNKSPAQARQDGAGATMSLLDGVSVKPEVTPPPPPEPTVAPMRLLDR